jgi:hypothetical protein
MQAATLSQGRCSRANPRRQDEIEVETYSEPPALSFLSADIAEKETHIRPQVPQAHDLLPVSHNNEADPFLRPVFQQRQHSAPDRKNVPLA